MAAQYVFLDPDGTLDLGLQVIVSAPTGVVYASQCACEFTEVRELEGFLVPLSPVDVPEDDEPSLNIPGALRDFFHELRGSFPMAPEDWTPQLIERLDTIVRRAPMWKTVPGLGTDALLHLSLDRSRIEQAAEAWVPVLMPYGPGILVSDNCD